MKIIKEYINEKFVADSDPISDMGIGVNEYKKKIQKHILTSVLRAMSENWMDIVEKEFNIPIYNVYFLADNENREGSIEFMNNIKSLIKYGKLIKDIDFISSTTSTMGNEQCIFKLYKTKYGMIGTFVFPQYNPVTIQYVGDAEIAMKLKLHEK